MDSTCKIVFGIRSNQLWEKLLTEDKVDLSICKTSEQAFKQLDEFESRNKSDKVSIVRNINNKIDTNHKCMECTAFN